MTADNGWPRLGTFCGRKYANLDVIRNTWKDSAGREGELTKGGKWRRGTEKRRGVGKGERAGENRRLKGEGIEGTWIRGCRQGMGGDGEGKGRVAVETCFRPCEEMSIEAELARTTELSVSNWDGDDMSVNCSAGPAIRQRTVGGQDCTRRVCTPRSSTCDALSHKLRRIEVSQRYRHCSR